MKIITILLLIGVSNPLLSQVEQSHSDIWRVYQWKGDLRSCWGYEEGVIEIIIKKDLSFIRYDYRYPGNIDAVDYRELSPEISTGRLIPFKRKLFKVDPTGHLLRVNRKGIKYLPYDSISDRILGRRFGKKIKRGK